MVDFVEDEGAKLDSLDVAEQMEELSTSFHRQRMIEAQITDEKVGAMEEASIDWQDTVLIDQFASNTTDENSSTLQELDDIIAQLQKWNARRVADASDEEHTDCGFQPESDGASAWKDNNKEERQEEGVRNSLPQEILEKCNAIIAEYAAKEEEVAAGTAASSGCMPSTEELEGNLAKLQSLQDLVRGAKQQRLQSRKGSRAYRDMTRYYRSHPNPDPEFSDKLIIGSDYSAGSSAISNTSNIVSGSSWSSGIVACRMKDEALREWADMSGRHLSPCNASEEERETPLPLEKRAESKSDTEESLLRPERTFSIGTHAQQQTTVREDDDDAIANSSRCVSDTGRCAEDADSDEEGFEGEGDDDEECEEEEEGEGLDDQIGEQKQQHMNQRLQSHRNKLLEIEFCRMRAEATAALHSQDKRQLSAHREAMEDAQNMEYGAASIENKLRDFGADIDRLLGI